MNDVSESKLSQYLQPWEKNSWRSMPIHEQQIVYQDEKHLNDVLGRLSELPPLVSTVRIDEARNAFKEAALGRAFILIGGDCAESFEDTKEELIRHKIELLIRQAKRLEAVNGRPVYTIGRLAGQYSKPRSKLTEILPDGRQVPAFRGHNINGTAIEDREPDPRKLLHGYWHSIAILHRLQSAERPIATAHEALHLPLETAVTKGSYNTSATFFWVGERTRQLNGAHLEYLRGLGNPIGVKIGPSMTPAEMIRILHTLCNNKSDTVGRVTIITRMGAGKAASVLPAIIEAVQESPFLPVWMCDPCHGNTFTHHGMKTRSMDTMLDEVRETVLALAAHGMHLGGLHLEQSGELVDECVATMPRADETIDMARNYRSLCDPRLSREQAQLFVEQASKIMQEVERSRNQPSMEGRLQMRNSRSLEWVLELFTARSSRRSGLLRA